MVVGHQPPALDGITLLVQLRQLYPDTPRLLVVDSICCDVLREAINRAAVHKVLTLHAGAGTLARELRDALRAATP